MARYGYARVSTTDQANSLETQTNRLREAGCDIIRTDMIDGKTPTGDREIGVLLDFIRRGDTLVATKVDRLARSNIHLQQLAVDLRARGVGLKILDQGLDLPGEGPLSPYAKMQYDMLAMYSEFETAIRRERQLEGIAAAKQRGIYKGRKATIPAEEVRRLHLESVGATEIARRLGISRNSVYRIVGKAA